MGDVIEIWKNTNPRCLCGWRFPLQIQRGYDMRYKDFVKRAEVSVSFVCPECGREHEVGWPDDKGRFPAPFDSPA